LRRSRLAPAPQHRAAPSGWTLLELVLSISIAVLVVTLLYSIYHTSMVTLRTQERTHSAAERTAEVLRQLGDDLSRATIPAGEEACGIVLEPAAPGTATALWHLELCTAATSDAEIDLKWHDIIHVEYSLQEDVEGSALVRTETALAGPGVEEPPLTNLVANGITALEVHFFDGKAWEEEWPEARSSELPLAVRLTIEIRHHGIDADATTELFLPAGTVVESTVGPSRP
jgi:type II secretion system protein J